ncbi:hypothetical protein BS78_05G123700 [Paspalum vaginatum]|nr:hypothetical protein BS78_05G123700 [Paspalum vaginatum]
MQVIDSRIVTIMSNTYVQTACALNPLVHYTMGTTRNVMLDMCKELERMLETDSAAVALQEYEIFRRKRGEFSTDMARRLVIDRKTSPAGWWGMFGSDTPTLSLIARCLLSYHKKLHNLVFVNYNLRLRLEHASKGGEPSEYDPVSSFMGLSLYWHQSAITEWMEQSRSNGAPAFDEDSEFSDSPLPSQLFTDIGRAHGDREDVDAWAEKTVGDTHLEKKD